MVWWLKEEKGTIPRLLLLVDKIGCFILLGPFLSRNFGVNFGVRFSVIIAKIAQIKNYAEFIVWRWKKNLDFSLGYSA